MGTLRRTSWARVQLLWSPFPRSVVLSVLILSWLHPATGIASAQTPHTLVPILNENTGMTTSTRMGPPASWAVNEAGDYVFLGQRLSALFYKKSSDSRYRRVAQVGDDLPDLPNVRIGQFFAPVLINALGHVAVRARIYTEFGATSAVLAYDGTSLRTQVTGFGQTPGGPGTYGPDMTLIDLNDLDRVAIRSVVDGLVKLFVINAAGVGTLAASQGDDTGTGTFQDFTGYQLANTNELLFSAVVGGSTGLFVSLDGAVHTVALQGQNRPSPATGTFGSFAATTVTRYRMNQANGDVYFTDFGLFRSTGAGNLTALAYAGLATSSGNLVVSTAQWWLQAVNNAGDVLFGANHTNPGGFFALLRYRPGQVIERIVSATMDAPGTNTTFTGVFYATMNATGTATFTGFEATTLKGLGVFRQAPNGPVEALILQGHSVAGGAIFIPDSNQFPTAPITLANGNAFLRADMTGSCSATNGHFIVSPGSANPLMTTADFVPPGARLLVGPNYLTAAGNYVGFVVQVAGGRNGVGVLEPGGGAVVVASDGDTVAGACVRIGLLNTVQVDALGNAVFAATLVGGDPVASRGAILAAGLLQPLTVVVKAGDPDSEGAALTGFSLAGALGVRPVPTHVTGMVAFSAIAGGQRGLFAGWPGQTPVKVAKVGDAAGGATVSSLASSLPAMTNAGQVVFQAVTNAGSGLFIASPGSGISAIAQFGDPAPGGGTFANFPTAAYGNSLGQVAFVATTLDGPGGGLYVGGAGLVPAAIALNGDAAPGGGTFNFTTARPDAWINDAGAIAFLANVQGITEPRLYIWRGLGQPIELLAAPGVAAPGGLGNFSSIGRLDGLIGQPHVLSETGEVAFRARVGALDGWFHVDSNGNQSLITIVGAATPDSPTAVVQDVASISSWMPGDRLPLWMPLLNGTHADGLYMWLPSGGSVTGTGPNVVVAPPDPFSSTANAAVSFASVSNLGTTTVTRSFAGPNIPVGAFRLSSGGGAPYYYIDTTATFTGPITICIDITDQTFPAGSVLRMLHYDGSQWVDVTTSVSGVQVCGQVASLSPFVVARALNVPAVNMLQNGDFSNGLTGWGIHQVPDIVHNSAAGGVFEYRRAHPVTLSGQAVVLQDTGIPVNAGETLVAHFDIGSTSNVPKRISVLIHRSFDFADLAVCTFWLPANAPLRTYAMRTHTTITWPSATISIYAASSGVDGAFYRLDNVVMGLGTADWTARTDCVDPSAPVDASGPDGAEMVVNGDFSGGLTGWTPYGADLAPPRLVAQVTDGVAEFIRPNGTAPSGVLLQGTGVVATAGQVVTATFQLGNSSGVRKRVTVLVHDLFFTDLTACTFWLAPGQPLSTYTVRTYVTQGWTSATISFYPATTDNLGWIQLDDVSMRVTQSAPTSGTNCVEPGDVGFASLPPSQERLEAEPVVLLASRAAPDAPAAARPHRQGALVSGNRGPTGGAGLVAQVGGQRRGLPRRTSSVPA